MSVWTGRLKTMVVLQMPNLNTTLYSHSFDLIHVYECKNGLYGLFQLFSLFFGTPASSCCKVHLVKYLKKINYNNKYHLPYYKLFNTLYCFEHICISLVTFSRLIKRAEDWFFIVNHYIIRFATVENDYQQG